MNYLEQIPLSYTLIFIGIALFFLVYVLSKVFTLDEGIFPKLAKKVNAFGQWCVIELSGIHHFLFGTITEAVDEFFVNELGFKRTGKFALFLWGSITLLSLWTSYNATREWAIWIGLAEGVAWALPLIIDLVIIAAIIQTAFYAYAGEDNFGVRAIVTTYTLASIFINIAHLTYGQALTFAIFVGGIAAPAGIWACSEQIYKTIRKMSYRRGIFITDKSLRDMIEERRTELADVEAKAKTFDEKMAQVLANEARLAKLDTELEEMEKLIAKADAHFKNAVPNSEGRLEQVRLMVEAGNGPEEIAKTMNISDRAARSYVRSAQRNGVS